ncbi:MAG: hypothetical protein M1309_03425 [Actinobacteria bacterium]|nr:hypothetical protein [Actinomycetota bacterium]
MSKDIKYFTRLSTADYERCMEELPGCESLATFHVCFEDGTGKSVCRRCFRQHIDEGSWITDALSVLAEA